MRNREYKIYKDRYIVNNIKNQRSKGKISNYYMQCTVKIRMMEILGVVFGKCQKKKEKYKRQYYHPIDIFKQIREDD